MFVGAYKNNKYLRWKLSIYSLKTNHTITFSVKIRQFVLDPLELFVFREHAPTISGLFITSSDNSEAISARLLENIHVNMPLQ